MTGGWPWLPFGMNEVWLPAWEYSILSHQYPPRTLALIRTIIAFSRALFDKIVHNFKHALPLTDLSVKKCTCANWDPSQWPSLPHFTHTYSRSSFVPSSFISHESGSIWLRRGSDRREGIGVEWETEMRDEGNMKRPWQVTRESGREMRQIGVGNYLHLLRSIGREKNWWPLPSWELIV